MQLIQGESQGNETDILLFRKNQLIFCELKSDLSSESKLADPLRQVIDQSLNMGKVRRVLILSPIIQANAGWQNGRHSNATAPPKTSKSSSPATKNR